jgi:hypothetical protein
MITIRHQNGTVCFQDGDYKVIISNLQTFSYLIEKFQRLCSHSDDEQTFRYNRHIIDMLGNARKEFIIQREKQCIRDCLWTPESGRSTKT